MTPPFVLRHPSKAADRASFPPRPPRPDGNDCSRSILRHSASTPPRRIRTGSRSPIPAKHPTLALTARGTQTGVRLTSISVRPRQQESPSRLVSLSANPESLSKYFSQPTAIFPCLKHRFIGFSESPSRSLPRKCVPFIAGENSVSRSLQTQRS